jgi:cytochrome c-type biogenesis protein CcmH
MPLAALRIGVSELPYTFSLDDSQAVMPQRKISDFPEVIVGARISKSGAAMPASGDLQGSSDVVALGSRDVRIVIDTVVP